MGDAAVVWSPATPTSAYHDVKAKAGLNSFSTPPTIAEINASSDWYQVVGLYNRRISQLFASPTPFSLAVDTLGRPTAASINDLRTKINLFRHAMQLADANFGSTLVQGMPIRGQHLIDLRTALNIGASSGTIGARSSTHIRVDHPYGTQTSESTGIDVAAGSGGSHINIGNIGVGSDIHRDRLPRILWRVQSLNAGVVVKYTFSGGTGTAKLYLSNTDDSGLPSGYESNLDSLCSSNAMVIGPNYDFSVPISLFNTRSTLSNLSLLLVESTEAANSNTGVISLAAPGTFTIDGGW